MVIIDLVTNEIKARAQPTMATAREPINRPNTYQRLPLATPISHLRTAAGTYKWARELARLVAPTFGGFLEGALEATEHPYTVLKTGQGRSETRL